MAMATFADLPNELLHFVAQHLAPTGCEDSKEGILAFRLLNRRTYLIANRYAFKYMTLYVRDIFERTHLGSFGLYAQEDSTGFDVRHSVKQIRFALHRELIRPDSTKYDLANIEEWYRKQAQRNFAEIIGKSQEALNESEKVLSEHYWKLFVEPYMPRSNDKRSHVVPDRLDLQSRIVEDIAYFPNLRTTSMGMENPTVDVTSEAYRCLDEKNLVHRFMDETTQEFYSFWKEQPIDFTISPTPSPSPREPLLVYTQNVYHAVSVECSLPGSVTKFVAPCIVRPMKQGGFVGSTQKRIEAQITDLEMTASPSQGRERTLIVYDIPFPNLRTLKLFSGYTDEATNLDHLVSYVENSQMLPVILRSVSSQHLTRLHIKRYAMATDQWRRVLRFGQARNFALHLEDIVLIEFLPDMPEHLTLSQNDVDTMPLRWLHELRTNRLHHLSYVTSRRLALYGKFRCVHHSNGTLTIWEQILREPVAKMLNNFMRTGLEEAELTTELRSEAGRCIPRKIYFVEEPRRWQAQCGYAD